MIAPDHCMDQDYPERRKPATTPSQRAGITPEKGETKVVDAVATGSPVPLVVVELPVAVVQRLLVEQIDEYVRVAELLRFNHEHSQWYLMIGNLLTQVGAADIIKNCATALAQENTPVRDGASRSL